MADTIADKNIYNQGGHAITIDLSSYDRGKMKVKRHLVILPGPNVVSEDDWFLALQRPTIQARVDKHLLLPDMEEPTLVRL